MPGFQKENTTLKAALNCKNNCIFADLFQPDVE